MIFDIEEIDDKTFRVHKKKNGKYYSEIYNYNDYVYIDEDNGKKMRYLNKDVLVSKKYGFSEGYEKDISSIKKFQMDNNLFCFDTDIQEKFKIISFDIESFNEEIVLLSVYSEDFKYVFSLKECDLEYVIKCDDEKDLLLRFSNLVREYDPDIIFGYNSDNFDFPLLDKRMKKYGLKIEKFFSRNNRKKIYTINRSRVFYLSGRIHLDVYKMVVFLDNIGAIKLQRFRLEEVYNGLFNKTKEKIFPKEAKVMWESGKIHDFVKYNMEDSISCYEIGVHFLQLFIEISRITGLPLFFTTRNNISKLMEFYLMRYSKEFDTLIPFKPKYFEILEREKNSYIGGYVKEPVPGLYENIVSLDFRSLYPSIIISHNIDVYTLDKCDCCKNENLAPNGHWFCKKIKALVPEKIKDLILRRFEIKKKLKKNYDPSLDERQKAIKTLANSIYGYFGYPNARWYSRECSEAITLFGRKYIFEAISFFESKGYKVIYADTDGFYINNANPKEICKLLEEYNSHLPEFMELEYENFYIRGIFFSKRSDVGGAKKRYVLVDENNNLKVKGLELVRRNVSNIAKKAQEEIIRILLIENDPKKTKNYLNTLLEEIRNYNFNINDFVIPTQITKKISNYKTIPPHIAALKRSGKNYKIGDIVEYLVLKGKGKISDRTILFEEFDGDIHKIDIDYYIEHQILPNVKPILEEIEKQETLNKWF